MRLELSPRSFLIHQRGFLSAPRAESLLGVLCQGLRWEQRSIYLFGRQVLQPRLIAWAGELPYRYSGQTLPARSFDPALEALASEVSVAAGCRFNHILLNRYRDGNDSMGFHADDEPELGPSPLLASLSLGAERRFVIVGRRDRSLRRELMLESGSLLVMGGEFQHEFRHALPKQRACRQERVNLTFRRLLRAPD